MRALVRPDLLDMSIEAELQSVKDAKPHKLPSKIMKR